MVRKPLLIITLLLSLLMLCCAGFGLALTLRDAALIREDAFSQTAKIGERLPNNVQPSTSPALSEQLNSGDRQETHTTETDEAFVYTASTAIVDNLDVQRKNVDSDSDLPLYEIHVNCKQNVVTVYTYDDTGEYSVPIRAMVCSCGLDDGTIRGEYKTYFKDKWQNLLNNVYGQYATGIEGNFLFHSVPYYHYEKPDSLETEEFNKLGESASLGCVRLCVADAKWIYDNCALETVVRLYDSDEPEPLGKPEPIKISDLNNGWDPTDEHDENPYGGKKPEIKTPNTTVVTLGTDFDPLKGVSAVDTCGNDITGRIKVTGQADTNRVGSYRLTYRVQDALHRTAEKSIEIKVTL